jgi:hypothetical protein
MFARTPHSVYRQGFWKPKPGPLVTDGRLAHVYLAEGLAVSTALFGRHAFLHCAPVCFFGFIGWELLFPVLHRVNPGWGGKHPFGDVVDLLSFFLGWFVGLVVLACAWL